MGELVHATMAATAAIFLFFPIGLSLAFLKATIENLRHSSEPVEVIVGGIVFLLNVGLPAALAVGPVIYNWEKHPLSSIVYATTLVVLFSYQRFSRQMPAQEGAAYKSVDHQSPKTGDQGSDIKPKTQEAGRCPHCGGPQADRVCWSCGRRS